MSAAFIVVVGDAHFGPFPGVAEAVRWCEHPDRPVEAVAYRVVPLFGGLFLDPLPGEPETVDLHAPAPGWDLDAAGYLTYPGQYGLTAVAS